MITADTRLDSVTHSAVSPQKPPPPTASWAAEECNPESSHQYHHPHTTVRKHHEHTRSDGESRTKATPPCHPTAISTRFTDPALQPPSHATENTHGKHTHHSMSHRRHSRDTPRHCSPRPRQHNIPHGVVVNRRVQRRTLNSKINRHTFTHSHRGFQASQLPLSMSGFSQQTPVIHHTRNQAHTRNDDLSSRHKPPAPGFSGFTPVVSGTPPPAPCRGVSRSPATV
jgi:hypothetical protein